MSFHKMYSIVLVLKLLTVFLVQGREDCPLWTTEKNGTCLCDDSLKGLVECEDGKGAQALAKCFCMTTGENSSSPVVGHCLYTCTTWHHSTVFKLKTSTPAELNNHTCGPFHRTGVLCSKCVEGYGLPVYSYSLSCVECKDYKYNWIKYIAVAYGPLTVFYLLAFTFRLSATSGLMICYVAICQMVTTRKLILMTRLDKGEKIGIPMVAIWNLDFFRSLYSPFCLHPRLSTIHVLMLDYLVATYPFVLILITYLLVKMCDKYKVNEQMGIKCIRKRFATVKNWDVKASLVKLFITFYLLSYVKVVNVTADILTATSLYNTTGEQSGYYLYYDASVPYLGEEHLPYAVFAMVFSLLFNLFPLLLLCLYPCACFHKCLNKTRCRCHTLHIFMDAILGAYSYKPKERRYFGSAYLILRVAHALILLNYNPISFLILGSFLTLIFSVLVSVFQPYKNPLHNKIDQFLLSMVAIVYMLIVYEKTVSIVEPFKHFKIISIIQKLIATVILLYGVVLLTVKILPCKFIIKIVKCARMKIQGKESLQCKLEQVNERNPILNF